MMEPVLVRYPSVIGASGLMVWTGDRFPAWRGSIFAGGLAKQDARRTEFGADGQVALHESLRIGQRGRDLGQGLDGLIEALTDGIRGRVFRREPGS